MIPNIGPVEIVIVLVVAVLILGPRKLPQAGRSLGSSLREFKAGITGEQHPAEVQLAPADPDPDTEVRVGNDRV